MVSNAIPLKKDNQRAPSFAEMAGGGALTLNHHNPNALLPSNIDTDFGIGPIRTPNGTKFL
jgi:hypothetical protein